MINTELQTLLNSYKIGEVGGKEKLNKVSPGVKSGESINKEFEDVLNGASQKKDNQNDLLLSQHAIKRMTERNITLDAEEFTKLKTALQKLKTKGGQDSLVITNKAAYILDVVNNKVVTAMDKQSLNDNVFTKIDSTLIL
jgi:flagellar operon protein